jgi:RNA polymerase sigma-70 factor, ECF subfamily
MPAYVAMATGSPEPAPRTDEELVAWILKGNQEAFGEVVGRYQDRLVSFIHRMLRDLDAAHDLAQEVFLRVYGNLDRFDPAYKFSTWIFRVAHNLAIDEIRKRRVRLVSLQRGEGEEGGYEWELPGHGRSPYQELRNEERGTAIQEAIASLPWDYRELILLRHFGELSYEEIAELKRMPLGTVKNKLFRGRQMLKERLRGYLGD